MGGGQRGAKRTLSSLTSRPAALHSPSSSATSLLAASLLAASLLAAVQPALSWTGTAPLLDGLDFSYGLSATPRFHRYTTASTAVPYPCSPAAGCSLGRTTDTGGRNTAWQLGHDFGLSLSAVEEKLTVGLSLQLLYSHPYAKSPSPRFTEEQLANPDNNGGDPDRLSTAFVADLGFQVHEGVGLSLGLWTPGGMRPDGDWYNPLANRHSMIYLDLVLTPVDGLLAELDRAKKTDSD